MDTSTNSISEYDKGVITPQQIAETEGTPHNKTPGKCVKEFQFSDTGGAELNFSTFVETVTTEATEMLNHAGQGGNLTTSIDTQENGEHFVNSK